MGIFSTLFGSKPKAATSESGNSAYPWLMQNYGGGAAQYQNAMGSLSGLLGLGGGGGSAGTPGATVDMWHDGIDGNAAAAQAAGQPTSYTIPGTAGSAGGAGGDAMGGFNNYLDSSAYKFIQDEAMHGLTNSAAGNYLLRSGSTAKALQDRSANIGKTYFDNYLNHVSDVAKLGLGAGGLIGDAGQWSKQTGGTAGSGGIFGGLMNFIGDTGELFHPS